MVSAKKWGILIKKESESLIYTGLKIPRDYGGVMEELNKMRELFSKSFDMVQEIAEKYPCSAEHVKTVPEQNNYNKETTEAYIKCELIAGMFRMQ